MGYYSITTEICVDGIMNYINKYNDSFYCIMTYVLLKSCNCSENFCYRRENYKIYLYNNLAASCTIIQNNKLIEFTNHIYYLSDLKRFSFQFHMKKTEAVNGKTYSDLKSSRDLIFITAMPWFRLKSMNECKI